MKCPLYRGVLIVEVYERGGFHCMYILSLLQYGYSSYVKIMSSFGSDLRVNRISHF